MHADREANLQCDNGTCEKLYSSQYIIQEDILFKLSITHFYSADVAFSLISYQPLLLLLLPAFYQPNIQLLCRL